MLPPAGEMAAAPTTAPSVGLHSSLAPAAESRHKPSAPPRAARYTSVESGANRGAAERAVGSERRLALPSSEMLLVSGTLQS